NQHAAQEVVSKWLPAGDFEERGAAECPYQRLSVAAGSNDDIGNTVSIEVRGGDVQAAADGARPHQLALVRTSVGPVEQHAAVCPAGGTYHDIGRAIAIDVARCDVDAGAAEDEGR